MAHQDTQPENTNFLSPLGFRFNLKRAPLVTFFCQATGIPSVSLPQVNRPTPFVNQPVHGDQLQFEPLQIRFRVDEDLKNYMEIFDWLVGLGTPHDFQSYQDLSQAKSGKMGELKNVVSDGTLTIMTGQHNPNVNVFFEDAFPTNLTTIQFDTTQTDIEYLEATATFAYRNFTLETIA